MSKAWKKIPAIKYFNKQAKAEELWNRIKLIKMQLDEIAEIFWSINEMAKFLAVAKRKV